MFRYVCLVALLISVSSIASDFKVQCDKFPALLTGGYCLHLPNNLGSGDIVYYLHGSGNNEFTWQEEWYYTAQVRKEWKEKKARLPIVVSISFGPIWLLAEKNSSQSSGLFELLISRIIPEIEKKLGGLKGRRLVLGESMGGFNSVQLGLKTAFFEKVAVLCAPMAGVSPFASELDIDAYVKKSSAWQYYKEVDPSVIDASVARIMKLIRSFFPTEDDWLKADPLKLAQMASKKTPLFYVSIGFYDKYVAFEGNEKFVEILRERGAQVEWRPQWGGHCSIDIPSLAAFLVQ